MTQTPQALTLHSCTPSLLSSPSPVKSHLTWQGRWRQGGKVIIHKGFLRIVVHLALCLIKMQSSRNFLRIQLPHSLSFSVSPALSFSLSLPSCSKWISSFVRRLFFLAASVYVCDKYVLEIRAQYLQVVRFGFLRLPVIFALWLWWVSFLCPALLCFAFPSFYILVFILFWRGGCI